MWVCQFILIVLKHLVARKMHSKVKLLQFILKIKFQFYCDTCTVSLVENEKLERDWSFHSFIVWEKQLTLKFWHEKLDPDGWTVTHHCKESHDSACKLKITKNSWTYANQQTSKRMISPLHSPSCTEKEKKEKHVIKQWHHHKVSKFAHAVRSHRKDTFINVIPNSPYLCIYNLCY